MAIDKFLRQKRRTYQVLYTYSSFLGLKEKSSLLFRHLYHYIPIVILTIVKINSWITEFNYNEYRISSLLVCTSRLFIYIAMKKKVKKPADRGYSRQLNIAKEITFNLLTPYPYSSLFM